eukprot:312103_1
MAMVPFRQEKNARNGNVPAAGGFLPANMMKQRRETIIDSEKEYARSFIPRAIKMAREKMNAANEKGERSVYVCPVCLSGYRGRREGSLGEHSSILVTAPKDA